VRNTVLMACGLVTCLALVGCSPPRAPEPMAAAPVAYPELPSSRRQLDSEIVAWCTDRKGLPETPAVCGCLSDQLHIQNLPDDGARELVHALYAVGPGSDPPVDRMQPDDRARLSRAAELCGTRLP
jgi:hypothetical protein